MDSFLGTLVFLLPGLMLYFWLQSFGINPVVKHTPAEFTGVAALLWYPVSITSLGCFNLLLNKGIIHNLSKPIYKISDLMGASKDFSFLAIYLGISLVISLIFSILWAKWGHSYLYLFLINAVRKWRGIAPLSENTSVWDEAFHSNTAQIIEISKLGEAKGSIGEIDRVSRTFEPGRDLLLRHTDTWEKIMEEYEVNIVNIFVDTKSGVIVKIYDSDMAKKAHDMYKSKKEAISSVSDQ